MKCSIIAFLLILSSCAITTPGKLADMQLEIERNERMYRDCVQGVEEAAVNVKYDSLILVGEPLELYTTVLENDTVFVTRTVTRRDTLRVTVNETKIIKVPDPTIKNENDLLRVELENESARNFRDIILFAAVAFVVGFVLSRTVK